ncbi:MAG: hypothetical protein IJF41_04145 [Clostridia bacterium]|nr:hypothetical protein [Clostridia bacterium]
MRNPVTIGIDTSCYTTSVAAADATGIVFEQKTMLFVQQGNRGLRQSDALFQHVKQLPDLVEAMMKSLPGREIGSVCVSGRPVDGEESYMPVFLAGLGMGRSLAAAFGCPLHITTHQRGHIRAAQIGNEQLMDKPSLLALHLSGGTTDLLLVHQENGEISSIDTLGSASDLHVGQFVDRVGVALGLPFPAGKHLEILAAEAEDRSLRIRASVQGLNCSFSGVESRAQQLILSGMPARTVAYGVYDCIARTLQKLLSNAQAQFGAGPVLFSGGVSSSLLLRQLLAGRGLKNLYFAGPGYGTDNAAGVALIGRSHVKA